MDTTIVEIEKLELKDERELLSPPWLSAPIYQPVNLGQQVRARRTSAANAFRFTDPAQGAPPEKS